MHQLNEFPGASPSGVIGRVITHRFRSAAFPGSGLGTTFTDEPAVLLFYDAVQQRVPQVDTRLISGLICVYFYKSTSALNTYRQISIKHRPQ